MGAFAYYRRVVEHQKSKIIEEVVRVAERVGASADVITDLKRAMTEVQFSKAVEDIKHGIPESLLISGHNPLTLLHSALSEGIHDLTDAECLERATTIRIILAELMERVGAALKEEAELDAALSRLLQKQKKPKA